MDNVNLITNKKVFPLVDNLVAIARRRKENQLFLFYAPWDPNSMELIDSIDNLAEDITLNLINIFETPDIISNAEKYQVRQIPSMIVVRNDGKAFLTERFADMRREFGI